MFTRPKPAARLRVASRPRTTQPSSASFEPVLSRPGAFGTDLHSRAQAELERLLQRLGHRPEAMRPARPMSSRACPKQTDTPYGTARKEQTFTQTQTAANNPATRPAHDHAQPPVQSSFAQSTPTAIERKLLEHKAVLVVMAVMVAMALAWSIIGQTVTSAGVERVAATVGLHAKKIASLEGQQIDLVATTTRRLDAMQVALAEVKFPPSDFAEAGDMFKAGRYVDAESAYHAFLIRNPNSRLADKAISNAAVAAAMSGNCSSTGAYLKQLDNQFKFSPLRLATKDLVRQCQKLRASSLKQPVAVLHDS